MARKTYFVQCGRMLRSKSCSLKVCRRCLPAVARCGQSLVSYPWLFHSGETVWRSKGSRRPKHTKKRHGACDFTPFHCGNITNLCPWNTQEKSIPCQSLQNTICCHGRSSSRFSLMSLCGNSYTTKGVTRRPRWPRARTVGNLKWGFLANCLESYLRIIPLCGGW